VVEHHYGGFLIGEREAHDRVKSAGAGRQIGAADGKHAAARHNPGADAARKQNQACGRHKGGPGGAYGLNHAGFVHAADKDADAGIDNEGQPVRRLSRGLPGNHGKAHYRDHRPRHGAAGEFQQREKQSADKADDQQKRQTVHAPSFARMHARCACIA